MEAISVWDFARRLCEVEAGHDVSLIDDNVLLMDETTRAYTWSTREF